MMLREVLQAVEAAEGPITLSELSRRLSIDPGVLNAMLEHWSRKGKLAVDENSGAACANMSPTCSCGSNSSGAGCPFMVRLPRSYAASRSAAMKALSE